MGTYLSSNNNFLFLKVAPPAQASHQGLTVSSPRARFARNVYCATLRTFAVVRPIQAILVTKYLFARAIAMTHFPIAHLAWIPFETALTYSILLALAVREGCRIWSRKTRKPRHAQAFQLT